MLRILSTEKMVFSHSDRAMFSSLSLSEAPDAAEASWLRENETAGIGRWAFLHDEGLNVVFQTVAGGIPIECLPVTPAEELPYRHVATMQLMQKTSEFHGLAPSHLPDRHIVRPRTTVPMEVVFARATDALERIRMIDNDFFFAVHTCCVPQTGSVRDAWFPFVHGVWHCSNP